MCPRFSEHMVFSYYWYDYLERPPSLSWGRVSFSCSSLSEWGRDGRPSLGFLSKPATGAPQLSNIALGLYLTDMVVLVAWSKLKTDWKGSNSRELAIKWLSELVTPSASSRVACYEMMPCHWETSQAPFCLYILWERGLIPEKNKKSECINSMVFLIPSQWFWLILSDHCWYQARWRLSIASCFLCACF